jgi:hypothetical protein
LDEERIEGQAAEETQETAPEAEVQEPAGAEPEITLSEDGDLDIPDSFWDDEKKPEEPEEGKEPQRADYYTPESFAEAYRNGQLDEGKIDPKIIEFYKAVAGVERRRQEAEALQRQATERAPKPQQRPQPSWEQVMEAAKIRATTHYLGIKPEEFDEFDERHKAARLMAVNEIREYGAAQERQEAQARQAWESRVAGVSNLIAEYRQKTPEIDEIANRFFPVWRQNLTMRQHEAVNYILSRGNETQVRQLFEKVIADYGAAKAPQRKAAPPEVMGTKGSESESSRGMVDVSNLAGLSMEDQAEFLIKNKLVV